MINISDNFTSAEATKKNYDRPYSLFHPYHYHLRSLMSAFSLSTAAGPSTATLKALSEYCASSDSPNSSFSHSESFLSYVTPVSSPKVVPELPDIIVQSDRFQSTSVQEKMVKALKFSTGSGFTRRAPTSRGRDRAVSTQVCVKSPYVVISLNSYRS
jgi:hypothetical protein